MLRSAHLRLPPSRGSARKGRRRDVRTIPALPARLCGAQPLRWFHSFNDPLFDRRRERTHLDRTIRSSRTACCPLQGCVKRWQLQDGESSQLFFGVSVRAVLYVTLSVP